MKDVTLDFKKRDVSYNNMETMTYAELETRTYAELQNEFYQEVEPKEVTIKLKQHIKDVIL